MVCEFCEKAIPVGLAVCPYCGKPQSSPSESGRRALWIIVMTAAMFAISIAWHYLVVAR
jgi:RNA polymerase subunit RPABC4/transcription elongation factor Spt4